MIKILIIYFFLIINIFAQNVILLWHYPTNNIEGTTFNIYSKTNLLSSNWWLKTNVFETNKIVLKVNNYPEFYAIKASNSFVESAFSPYDSSKLTIRARNPAIIMRNRVVTNRFKIVLPPLPR